MELAIAVLRASAPNKIAARQRVEDAGQLRSTDFAEPVPKKGRKEAIALAKRRNQERAEAVLEKVRQMSKRLSAAADSRFDLQTQIVASALAWDDPVHIWQIIGGPATSADVDQKEPYFETAVPLQLVVRLRHSGDKATAEKIESQSSSEPPSETVLDLLAQRAVEIDDADGLAREMQKLRTGTGEKAKLERSDLERAALAASSRLLHAGKVAKAIEFVRMFDDSQLKEEALEWTAALACRLNHTGETKEILKAASFIPTESVSAYRGFLMGLLARDLAPEAGAPTATSQPNAAATNSPPPPRRASHSRPRRLPSPDAPISSLRPRCRKTSIAKFCPPCQNSGPIGAPVDAALSPQPPCLCRLLEFNASLACSPTGGASCRVTNRSTRFDIARPPAVCAAMRGRFRRGPRRRHVCRLLAGLLLRFSCF